MLICLTEKFYMLNLKQLLFTYIQFITSSQLRFLLDRWDKQTKKFNWIVSVDHSFLGQALSISQNIAVLWQNTMSLTFLSLKSSVDSEVDSQASNAIITFYRNSCEIHFFFQKNGCILDITPAEIWIVADTFLD